MKFFTFFIPIFFSINCYSQINLEHTYPNMSIIGTNVNRTLEVVDLGNQDYKYLFVDKINSYYALYNLNHSLYISGNFPVTWNNNNYSVFYFSKTLFDCDSNNVEYVLSYKTFSPNTSYVRIYRTDGTVVFNKDSVTTYASFGSPGIHRYFINNTPSGSKMILDHSFNGDALVYSLCDSLPLGYSNHSLIENNLFNYPNPSKNYTTIEYTIPEGNTAGKLIFYDSNGTKIKSFDVDKNFDNLRISVEDLPSGIYYYSLVVNSEIIGTNKMIKIN